MDVNATLKELRELAEQIQKDFESDKVSEYDANRMAELFQALNEWIMKGGFLPAEWQGKRS